jgi:type IX secretion system PorP/SprF family membrane protein
MMKLKIAVFLLVVLSALSIKGQEEQPFISFEVPSQNLLKFNRFLINPTFSSVREDQSYVNLFHRNQWVQFEDSPELYFASYSGRIGDRTGFGLGLYQQKLGVISNFGILANYAYGVRLNEKMNLTFGFNLSYFSSGLDSNQILSGEVDPVLLNLDNGSFLSFQPGFNLSIGSFDFGLYAENLVDYNLRTSESLTSFSEKTFSGHLMYTRKFKKTTGILTGGKLSVLSRVRKQGDRDVNLSGSLIADLPKLGWLQGGYDDFYGVSAGIGFNLTKRLSLGYTIEKGLNSQTENLGPTHEITFAYSFQPNLTDDRVMLEEEEETLAELEQKLKDKDEVISDKDEELARIRKNLAENSRVLAELIIKQDSMERAVTEDIERRFYHLIKTMKGDPSLDNNVTSNNKSVAKTSKIKSTKSYNRSNKDFINAAKANNIRQQSVENLAGVQGGYYIIANVYSDSKKGRFYRNKFVENLDGKGLNATYFKNPNNNLSYVYLERYDTWQEAVEAYKTDMNNSYEDDIWIMSVANQYEDGLLAENTKSDKVETIEKNKEVVTTTVPSSEAKRLNSPSEKDNVITDTNKNNVTVNKSKTEKRITSPVNNRKVVTKPEQNNKKNSDAAFVDLEDRTEEEIKNIYSKNTSKKRKTPKKGSIFNIDTQEDGYYIIANVFSVPSNANRFIAKLKKQGIKADYFINPENNYRYVYLKKHDSWNSALASYYSNLNDSYYDDIWIMRVNINYVL